VLIQVSIELPVYSVRFLPEAYQLETPRPIVLDPKLRLPPNARMLLALKDDGTPHAKAPWLLCQTLQDWDQDIRKRKAALEEAGARVVEIDMPEGKNHQNTVHILYTYGRCLQVKWISVAFQLCYSLSICNRSW